MHAGDLVHLAALVATHGAALVQHDQNLPAGSLQRYWAASKCRLDRWQRILRLFALKASGDPLRSVDWKVVRPVVEEILLSEVLSRVWTALLSAHDRCHGRREAEPIARSVLHGQFEARRRALSLMVHGPGVLISDAVALNRLRRKTERWSDLLLARLSGMCDIDGLTIEPSRTANFAADLHDDAVAGHTGQAWTLLLASLQATFPSQPREASPNADLNERIAASVLACLPAELFNSLGILPSLWMVRLRYAPDDAQGMLDELWRMEGRVRTPKHADQTSRS